MASTALLLGLMSGTYTRTCEFCPVALEIDICGGFVSVGDWDLIVRANSNKNIIL
jgi:hypothetical protein